MQNEEVFSLPRGIRRRRTFHRGLSFQPALWNPTQEDIPAGSQSPCNL
jgi:hypothetical protein